MRRQGVLVAADLARQVGQLEVGLRQGPPRGDVGLLAEQGAELAVEVRRRFQEPVAQVLEFLFLEQEVLTDAGVERLDGLDGQVVAGLDLGVGGRERRCSCPPGRALARACTASTADRPTTPASTAAAAPVTPVRCRVSQRDSFRVQGSAQAETGSSAIHRSTSSARARHEG